MPAKLLLATLTLVVAHCAAAAAADDVAVGGVTLRNGELFARSGSRLVAAAPGRIVDLTVSPNRRFVVYVRRSADPDPAAAERVSLWIHDRTTHRQIQVGRGLGAACCEIGKDADEPSHVFGTFRRVNGAYWSRSQQLLVRFRGQTHILSMNGVLRGDV